MEDNRWTKRESRLLTLLKGHIVGPSVMSGEGEMFGFGEHFGQWLIVIHVKTEHLL